MLKIPFRVIIPNIDETLTSTIELEQVPELLAREKVTAVIHSLPAGQEIQWRLGADTVILYEGKVMVDEQTGSPWARPGAKKVVTDRDLKYSNPKATPHWFDTAKENHGESWVREVKKIAGGG